MSNVPIYVYTFVIYVPTRTCSVYVLRVFKIQVGILMIKMMFLTFKCFKFLLTQTAANRRRILCVCAQSFFYFNNIMFYIILKSFYKSVLLHCDIRTLRSPCSASFVVEDGTSWNVWPPFLQYLANEFRLHGAVLFCDNSVTVTNTKVVINKTPMTLAVMFACFCRSSCDKAQCVPETGEDCFSKCSSCLLIFLVDR